MEVLKDQMQAPKKMNGACLASFILALVGIIVAGIPCGIAAIISGGIGLSKFNPETQKNNKWMAIIGIIVGIIDIVVVIVALPSIFKQLGL